jgi:2-hydroxy-3-keto-5-methylthiopentenyl-1-phosphate phosphatase
MNLVVLCDFDGTITNIDTSEFVLARFALGDWRSFDEQYQHGEITLEECMVKQFALVRTSKKQMLKELNDVASFRPNFLKFAEYCRKNRIALIIVSAGLDFVIKYFLKQNHCLDLAEICSPETQFTDNIVTFKFLKPFDETSENFKQDCVRYYKIQGKKVIYLGDGTWDFPAAKEADIVFAIEGSKLSDLCKTHHVPFKSMTDFNEVIDIISTI